MTPGKCQLCGEQADLVDSDVWSRFGYKLYVADHNEAGVFADLKQMRRHGKRLTDPLFCAPCDNKTLSQHETHAAKFCRDLNKAPASPINYGPWLLPFLTSLALRTVLTRSEPETDADFVAPAVACWRQFLLSKRTEVGPYSQHLFVTFDPRANTHLGFFGLCVSHQGFDFTQFGPLWTAALLGRDWLPPEAVKIWERSQILPTGGTLQAAPNWRDDVTMPPVLHKFLLEREQVMIAKAVKYTEKLEQRNKKKRP